MEDIYQQCDVIFSVIGTLTLLILIVGASFGPILEEDEDL